MTAKKTNSTVVGLAVLVVGFALLYFVPKYLAQRRATVVIPGTATKEGSVATFPTDRPLSLIEVGPRGKVVSKKQVRLKDLVPTNGGTLIVNFWATWCPPCIEEMPSLEFLHRQLKNTNRSTVLVAISVDSKIEDIASLYGMLDFSPSFLLLHDEEGRFASSVGTSKFPETYWIDGNGSILHKWLGPQDWLSASVLQTLKRG